MDCVRRRLGIEEGGSDALCAMALLTGNDYHLEGAKGIGMTLAWEAISALLSGATVRCLSFPFLSFLRALLSRSTCSQLDFNTVRACSG